MLARLFSYTTIGIEARQIEIEVDIGGGLPHTIIVGLPDTAIRESKDRVSSAIKNSDFFYPSGKVTINLAPADIKKEGPVFDLPIAIGILVASGQVNFEQIKDFIFIGELALNGRVRPVKGILPIAVSLKNSNKKIFVPYENINEARIVEGIEIYPAKTLREICNFLNGSIKIESVGGLLHVPYLRNDLYDIDFSDVKGQFLAKRALEIAAAGGHNVLMIGPPGSGKTMLAKRLPGILPDMTLDESLETTKIHSVAGLITSKGSIVNIRPFRTPHHTASDISLIGGGTIPKPGEVSLAHNGVLFMDELPEFHRNVLEALRQPLEDGYVTVSRINSIVTFPSKFMLIGAMNPCPCGYFTDTKRQCHCSPNQIQRYLSKISGPLLDRIDLHIEVPSVRYKDLSDESSGERSHVIRERVKKAREIQIKRFKDEGIFSNSQMGYRLVRKYCRLDEAGAELLKSAIIELGLSARCYDKILRISRTIADLEARQDMSSDDVAEAIQYRSLDRLN